MMAPRMARHLLPAGIAPGQGFVGKGPFPGASDLLGPTQGSSSAPSKTVFKSPDKPSEITAELLVVTSDLLHTSILS